MGRVAQRSRTCRDKNLAGSWGEGIWRRARASESFYIVTSDTPSITYSPDSGISSLL